MSDELLAHVWEEAERLYRPVRVAALLRIARVETAFDRDEARRTFQQALEARRLSHPDGESLVDEARFQPRRWRRTFCARSQHTSGYASKHPMVFHVTMARQSCRLARTSYRD